MNAKLIFKTLFVLLVLFLLVMIGNHNRSQVNFSLPPVVRSLKQPAAYMYFGFFAVGFLTATVVWMGGGKKGGGSSPSKPAKSAK